MQSHHANDNQRERDHLDRCCRLLEIENSDGTRQCGADTGPDRVRDAQLYRFDGNRVERERAGIKNEHHDAGGDFREATGELHAGRARDFKQDCAAQKVPG